MLFFYLSPLKGNVRLAGGANEHEGIVELQAGGDEWVSMAHRQPDEYDSYALSDWICSYLGYQFAIGATGKPASNNSSQTLCKYGACPQGGVRSGFNFFNCIDEGTLILCPPEWNSTVVGVICAQGK